MNEALHYAIGRGRLEIVTVFIQVWHAQHTHWRVSICSSLHVHDGSVYGVSSAVRVFLTGVRFVGWHVA